MASEQVLASSIQSQQPYLPWEHIHHILRDYGHSLMFQYTWPVSGTWREQKSVMIKHRQQM